MPLFVLSTLLSSLWVSRTGSASDWCTLQEALYKCINTIQYSSRVSKWIIPDGRHNNWEWDMLRGWGGYTRHQARVGHRRRNEAPYGPTQQKQGNRVPENRGFRDLWQSLTGVGVIPLSHFVTSQDPPKYVHTSRTPSQCLVVHEYIRTYVLDHESFWP